MTNRLRLTNSHKSICCTPLQKQQQRDVSAMKDLMEICCLWHEIAPKIEVKLGHEHFAKLKDMFLCGTLALLIFEKTYFLNLQYKTSIWDLEKNRVQNLFSHQGFGEKPCTKSIEPGGPKSTVVFKFRATIWIEKKKTWFEMKNGKLQNVTCLKMIQELYCGIWKPRYFGPRFSQLRLYIILGGGCLKPMLPEGERVQWFSNSALWNSC